MPLRGIEGGGAIGFLKVEKVFFFAPNCAVPPRLMVVAALMWEGVGEAFGSGSAYVGSSAVLRGKVVRCAAA